MTFYKNMHTKSVWNYISMELMIKTTELSTKTAELILIPRN